MVKGSPFTVDPCSICLSSQGVSGGSTVTLQCQRGSCPAPRKSTVVKGLPLTVDPLEKEGPPHVHAAGHVHVYMHVGRCAVCEWCR